MRWAYIGDSGLARRGQSGYRHAVKHGPRSKEGVHGGASIDGVDASGRGRVRLAGHLLHVESGLPGDRVRAGVQPVCDDDPRALETLALEPSSRARRAFGCEHAPRCGGCRWQHVELAAQRRWKSAMVRRLLTARAGLSIERDPPVTATRGDAYRSRLLLRAHVTDGRLLLGLFARGARALVDLERCEVADEPLNAALTRLRALDVGGLPDHRFRLALTSFPAADGLPAGVRGLLTPATVPAAPALEVADRIRRAGALERLDAPRSTDDSLRACDVQDGVTFYAAAGLFEQANRGLNQALRLAVRRRVDAIAPARVLDLHCGNGNLSLLLLRGDDEARVVRGVDTNPLAIAAARRGLASHGGGLDTETYRVCSAARALHELRASPDAGRDAPTLALLDPPRAGLEPDRHAGVSALTLLMELRPRDVLYVSCDPRTLARELARLREEAGYQLVELELFDLFPGTQHIEALAWLRAS